MRALLVLPIAMAVGAWDPCTPSSAVELSGANAAGSNIQLLNSQLNLAACVSRHAPRAMLQGGRASVRARVRAACIGFATGNRAMTIAQASALADRLVDQEIDFLTKCRY